MPPPRSPESRDSFAARAAAWAKDNKGVVTIVAALLLGGSVAISYLPDDRSVASSGPGASPSFEAPARFKGPALQRASPESLVRGPAPEPAEPADRAVADDKGTAAAPGRDGLDEASYEGMPAAPSFGGDSASTGKPGLKKLDAFAGGGGGGGSGSSPSFGGSRREPGDGREGAGAGGGGSAPTGALAFVRRQLGNAGKRLGRLLGSGSSPGVSPVLKGGGGPNASAPAATTTGFSVDMPGGKGAAASGPGATGASPGGSAPASHGSSGGTGGGGTSGGGGGGSAPASTAKPASHSPPPAAGKKDDGKAGPATAASGEVGGGHACAKDKASTKCGILTCLENDEFWKVNIQVADALHGATGNIVKHHDAAAVQQQEKGVDAVDKPLQELRALRFDCESCSGLEQCRRNSQKLVEAARKKGVDAVKLSKAAALVCTPTPYKQKKDGGLCKGAGDKAKDEDMEFGRLARENLPKAAGCDATVDEEDAGQLEAWNRWADALRSQAKTISATFDKALCPDRVPCDPGPHEPALAKLDRGIKDVEIFRSDLPAVIDTLGRVRDETSAALKALAKAKTDEGALRDFVFANDRAAWAATVAKAQFDKEKAQACKLALPEEPRRRGFAGRIRDKATGRDGSQDSR